MSDLSQPALSLLTTEAALAWPTPDLPGYPAPEAAAAPLPCRIEGVNGHLIEGQLELFDPERGVLQLRMTTPRRPLPLRLDQFRRLELKEPLAALPPEDDSLTQPPPLPFRIEFVNAPAWEGETLGHVEADCGLFLFEPIEGGALRRWFVPRSAWREAHVGLPLGETLVQQHSATPQQIQSALYEQEQLRNRKIGEVLVVRQIITPAELLEAIEHQARMPMVRIGEALTSLGLITQAQLEDALLQQRQDRSMPLGELLVKMGVVSRSDLQTALARKLGYPLVDALQFPAETEAITRLPYAVATRVPALPLMWRAGRLVTAVEDPSNRARIDEIEFAAQCKVVPVLARTGVLPVAIARAYEKVGATELTLRGAGDGVGAALDGDGEDASKLVASMERSDFVGDHDGEVAIEQSDNTLVRLINSMIVEAHAQGVSDIHVECPGGREKVRIRFRKDGLLRPYLELPPAYRHALIARLKIMCDLDISERRKPQDGKINFARYVQGMKLELRVATVPTSANLEDAVLRLLASTKPMPIESLGLSPRNLECVKAVALRPYGMLLCVGPTGSGKTTTLHSVLGSINTPERKIWTAEDPVEITQPGLRQVQVNPRIEWTFERALRSFLRADPDVIMVGEIRDRETAQVAIEAALTGHLMLSTLHTNNAPETVTRLLDMGMDPFNFADALLAVLAQRLVRRLCPQCRIENPASAEETEELLADYRHPFEGMPVAPTADEVMADWRRRFGGEDGRLTRYTSAGCDHCSGTGYRGRAGIHELMMVDRALRHLIQTGRRADDLQQCALGAGMRTLRQDGIEKVLAGVTSIDEVRANS